MPALFKTNTQVKSFLLSCSEVCQNIWQRCSPSSKTVFEQSLPILESAHSKRVLLERNPDEVTQYVTELRGIDPAIMLPRVSKDLGGLGLSFEEAHLLKMLLSRSSGALSFLLTQNQTAADLIAASSAPCKREWLDAILAGKLFAMAQSPHMARFENPTVLGEVMFDKGYTLSTKELRWVTGHKHASRVIAGFFDAKTKEEITAVLPFDTCVQIQGGRITCSKPVDTEAAYSANTVSLTIENWRIQEDEIITRNPPGTFSEKIRYNTNLDSYQAGVIAELITFIRNNSKHPLTDTIVADFTTLLTQLETMIIHRNKLTDIQPIRAFAITIFNDLSSIARQLLLGRALLNLGDKDPLIANFRLLRAEGCLYSAAVPGNELLELTYQQTMRKYEDRLLISSEEMADIVPRPVIT